jgi:hypothetical protein
MTYVGKVGELVLPRTSCSILKCAHIFLDTLYLKWCTVIWEKQYSCHMHVVAMEDTMCGTENVLDITHDNPSTSTRHISFARGQLSQSAIWHTLCENQLHRLHNIQYKGYSHGTNTSIYSSLNGCYTRLCTPLNFCTMCCGLMRQYLQVVVYTI